MKTILKYILAGALFAPVFTSCEDDLLNEEHYKKVIYLKSGDNNIFTYSHAMNDSITRGYMTVGSGGSMPLDNDVVVTLKLDTAAFNDYNYRLFDLETDKYARLLDSTRYTLPSFDVVIRAGEPAATAFFPIEVDANGLSPDSVYMVPLRIASASGLEINPEKDLILYQLILENQYSSNASRSYRLKGTKQKDGGALSNISVAAKTVLPLARNRVRLFPEVITQSTKLSDIENKSIVLIVDKDNTVRVRPYKNIQIEQMDGCHYNPEQKTFKLFYRYKLPNESTWTTVVESLMRVE